jgi:cytochrome c oxidase subunit 2
VDAVIIAQAAPTATFAPPTPATSADAGRTLFLTKGCSSCHQHEGLNLARVSAVGGQTVAEILGELGAPDLTHYQPNPDFVREWLQDPAAIRPNTAMPDLGLTEDEIEALLAFLHTNSAEE